MINSFVESTGWKRTATFGPRSWLSLVYCLIVVLGGILIANESHAQTCLTPACLGDRIVVQNVGKPELNVEKKGLYIREKPSTESADLGGVYDDYEGIVTFDKDGKHMIKNSEIIKGKKVRYVWYYVKWFDSGKKGWSAGMIDDYKYIVTTEENDQKNVITEALFNDKNYDKTEEGYITYDDTLHDYNDYGCNADTLYGGKGHAGWDVRTKDDRPSDQVFYSLTKGKLILSPKCNAP